MTDFDDVLQNPVTRRAFLARMAAAGLGAAATGLLLAGCGGSTNTTNPAVIGGGGGGGGTVFFDPNNFPGIPGSSEDIVVLNFALTLETLEADLYRQAINLAAGKAVTTPAPENNNYSSYTLAISAGDLSAEAAAAGFLYLQQYAGVEAAHRDFLRTAIGAEAVSANAKGYTAPFGATLKSILTLISAVEEQGVRAYLGAAGFINTPAFIVAASSIYTTEARHSAGVNYVLGLDTGPTPGANGQAASTDMKVTPTYPATNTFEYFDTPKQVLQYVKPFIV